MKVREAMDYYFEKLLTVYSKENPPYPFTSYVEDADEMIYIGNPDESEWLGWKPILKDKKDDFEKLSELLKVKIHPSVEEYYNSYWFCDMGGRFGEFVIQLDEVLPNLEMKSLVSKIIGYREAHDGLVKDTPIGFETNQGLLVVVDNETGNVKLEDYEINKFTVLSDTLSDLILGLADSLDD